MKHIRLCLVALMCSVAIIPSMAFVPMMSNAMPGVPRFALTGSRVSVKTGLLAAKLSAVDGVGAKANSQKSASRSLLAPAATTLAALFSTASGLPAALLISLVMSSVGFISAVYFVGYGYGLSMVAMGALTLRHFSSNIVLSKLALWHACMVIAWGARIFGFLLFRETVAWPGLRERTKETNKKFTMTSRVSTWLFVSVFYTLLFSPVLFHVQTPSAIPALAKTGLIMSLVGLILEAQSDQTKSAFKAQNPDAFMSTGLYTICRHPNYLGEIIFWTGSFVCSLGSLSTPLHWSAASVGLAGIVAIMSQATDSLEKKQALKYGTQSDYKAYVKQTPKLLPFTGGDNIDDIVKAATAAKAAKEAKDAAKAKDVAVASKPAQAKATATATASTSATVSQKAASATVSQKAASASKPTPSPTPEATDAKIPGEPKIVKIIVPQSQYSKNKKPWDV